MIRSDKRLAELKKVFDRGINEEMEEAVSNLRNEEPFEGALMLLAWLYDSPAEEGLRQSISHFFNDMKENSARGEVIKAIASVNSQATKTMLVSSCWQSGLDYSEYTAVIAEAFIEGDYNTSLECFTVLDISAGAIPVEEKKKLIGRLEKTVGSFDDAKQQLARELITLLAG